MRVVVVVVVVVVVGDMTKLIGDLDKIWLPLYMFSVMACDQ